jgi:dihydrofolate reductase
VVSNLDEAMAAAADVDAKEAFIIGGGEIYKQTMPLIHRIYITRVHAILQGDTSFPVIDENEWELLSQLDFKADEKT